MMVAHDIAMVQRLIKRMPNGPCKEYPEGIILRNKGYVELLRGPFDDAFSLVVESGTVEYIEAKSGMADITIKGHRLFPGERQNILGISDEGSIYVGSLSDDDCALTFAGLESG